MDLLDRVSSLESLLRATLPKCGCGALATRTYRHCAGYLVHVCDAPECLEEDYCDECGQVWYGDLPNCDGYTENGPCSGTSKHPETSHVSYLQDVPHADIVRSL